MDGRRVTLTPGTTLRFDSLGFVYTRPVESVAGRTFTRLPRPNVLTGAAGCEAFVRGFSDDVIIGMLGPNPTQERFRLAAYYLTDLAFQASGDEPLGWGEFMERYTAMHLRGHPGLPDDPVTAYIDSLRTTGAAPGSTTTRRARTTRHHDPTRECNVCLATNPDIPRLQKRPIQSPNYPNWSNFIPTITPFVVCRQSFPLRSCPLRSRGKEIDGSRLRPASLLRCSLALLFMPLVDTAVTSGRIPAVAR
jgi:hypothetical protein